MMGFVVTMLLDIFTMGCVFRSQGYHELQIRQHGSVMTMDYEMIQVIKTSVSVFNILFVPEGMSHTVTVALKVLKWTSLIPQLSTSTGN